MAILFFSLYAVFILGLLECCAGQTSPSSLYCNRIYHSAIVVDRTLYVDGGEIRSVSKANNTNLSVLIPDTVDTIDLSSGFSNTDTSIWKPISKNGSNASLRPPTLNGGTMFSDGSQLYLFGGGISVANPAINAPTSTPANGVWQYGISSGQWSRAALGGGLVQRMSYGASVQSSSSANAYYLSGVKHPAADPYFWTVPGATPYLDQGLLTLNEEAATFQNSSTLGLNDFGTAAEGFLSLIETLGTKGVLVAFGGYTNAAAKAMNITDDQLQIYGTAIQWNLSSISLYDIGNQTWYQQPHTGDIPRWRHAGCSVVVSAPDQSSHSIYVFGGWGGTFEGSDGDVYVLSIPSFRWIRVNSESNVRSRHQCSLIGNHTMLVVGGIVPLFDFPLPIWTPQGCDNMTMFTHGLGMFSLNNHSWSSTWEPAAGTAPYKIHTSISKVIGGDSSGSATLTKPADGFNSTAVARLFGSNQSKQSPGTNPSSDPMAASVKPNSRRLTAGAIAGIVLGSIAGLAILSALVLLLVSHRRRKPRQQSVLELSGQNFRKELGTADEKVVGVNQVWRSELDDGTEKVHELCSQTTLVTEKPLPSPPEKDFVELSGDWPEKNRDSI